MGRILQKRIFSLVVVLALVISCLIGLFVPVMATDYGVGFITTDTVAEANEYWTTVNIYDLFNSASSGFYLTTYCYKYYCGLYMTTVSGCGYPVLVPGYVSSLSPFTIDNYPFGSFVSDLAVESYSSSCFDYLVYRCYEDAYSDWVSSGGKVYFLTSDSYISLPTSASECDSYVWSCYLNSLGRIDSAGTVTYGKSVSFRCAKTGYSISCTGLVPNPDSSTDDGSGSVDTSQYLVWTTNLQSDWTYLALGSEAPELTVEAVSNDGGTITYQWSVQDNNNHTAKTIDGATSNTYAPPTDELGSWMYWCTATNTSPDGTSVSITSNVYCVTVNSDGSSGDQSGGSTDQSGGVSSDQADDIKDSIDENTSWLERIWTDFSSWYQQILDAINSLGEKLSSGSDDSLDDLESSVGEILSGGDGGDNLIAGGDKLEDAGSGLGEDLGAIQDFESVYMGQLEDNLGDIIAGGDMTMLVAPLSFVQVYLNKIVAGVPSHYMVVFTLPMLIGLFLYIVGHPVRAPRPDTSGDTVTRETFTQTTILTGRHAGESTSTRTVTTSQEIGRVHRE